MEQRMVKSFEDMFREHYGLAEDFTSDAYVEYMAKSGAFGESLAKAAGGIQYGASGPGPANALGNTGTGYPTAFQNYSDLTPLRIQNLDATLTSILFKRQNFKLWDWLPKVPTIQTTYEYDRINSYGSGRSAGGFAEGGIPALSLPGYERDNATVRYIGVQRGVTQQSRMVGKAGGLMLDPVRTEVENGTMVLLEKITRALYFGDSTVLDEAGNAVNYDGLLTQINAQGDSTVVIDLQGNSAKLGFNLFDNVATLFNEQGFISDFSKVMCFMNPHVLSDLSKLNMQQSVSSNVPMNIRQMLGQSIPSGGYTMGQPLKGYESNFGFLPFQPDVFLQEVKGNVPVCQPGGTADTGAPGSAWTTPLGSCVLATVSTTGATLPANTFYYWLSAVGVAGESAPVALGSLANTNNSIQIKQPASVTTSAGVQANYGTAGQPVQYRVYRSQLSNPWNGSQWIDPNGGLIGHFSQPVTANAGNSAVLFTDTNAQIPGTNNILIIEGSQENLVVPMLTPLLKYNLPPIGTLEPFMLMLYHTIVLKSRKRAVWIRNIPSLS